MGWVRCGLGTPSSVLSLPTPSEASGAIARFNTDLTENLLSAVAEFSASQASGTPTPSAPIPIVGVDKVNVSRTGKNLCGGSRLLANAQAYLPSGTTDTENKTFTYAANAMGTSGLSFTSGIRFKQNTAYTMIVALSKSNTGNLTNIQFGYTDGTYTNQFLPSSVEANTKIIAVFTSNASKTLSYIRKANQGGNTTIYYDETGVFEGTITTLDFEPYNGTTALINLGGTYYGGSVDAVTGKITLTHQFYNSLGTNISNVVKDSSSWRVYYSSAFYGTDNQYKEGLCDSLGFKTSYNEVNGNNNSIGFNASAGNQILIRNDTLTSEQEVRDFMATLDVVYPLATPIVVYAQNTAEIPTIVGDNQVFTDSGNIVVKFFETVGHKI